MTKPCRYGACDNCLGCECTCHRPLLAETPEDALRMAVAGRRLAVLTETQVFDADRLEASPLFKPTTKKLF